MSVSSNVPLSEKMKFLKVLSDRVESVYPQRAYREVCELMESITGKRALDWISDAGPFGAADERALQDKVARRLAGEPLEYLTGKAFFKDLVLTLEPGTFIPRPETEILADEAIRLSAQMKGEKLDGLDLGTGSGNIAIAVSVAVPRLSVHAVEKSKQALSAANQNIKRLSLDGRIHLMEMDYLKPGSGRLKESYDVIMANPPYIAESEYADLPLEVRREPKEALLGGSSGLERSKWILCHYGKRLKREGALLMEMGKGQDGPLRAYADSLHELCCERVVSDYQDIPRVIVIRKKG